MQFRLSGATSWFLELPHGQDLCPGFFSKNIPVDPLPGELTGHSTTFSGVVLVRSDSHPTELHFQLRCLSAWLCNPLAEFPIICNFLSPCFGRKNSSKALLINPLAFPVSCAPSPLEIAGGIAALWSRDDILDPGMG